MSWAARSCLGRAAAGGEDASGGVTLSAVSNKICWSGRGRSPFHTRAAVAVSGWPAMLTRVMSPVPAGRGSRITPGGGPAMAAGPVSTAAGRLALARDPCVGLELAQAHRLQRGGQHVRAGGQPAQAGVGATLADRRE